MCLTRDVQQWRFWTARAVDSHFHVLRHNIQCWNQRTNKKFLALEPSPPSSKSTSNNITYSTITHMSDILLALSTACTVQYSQRAVQCSMLGGPSRAVGLRSAFAQWVHAERCQSSCTAPPASVAQCTSLAMPGLTLRTTVYVECSAASSTVCTVFSTLYQVHDWAVVCFCMQSRRARWVQCCAVTCVHDVDCISGTRFCSCWSESSQKTAWHLLRHQPFRPQH